MIYPILVVVEKGETSYGAYAPDLPGCIAVGDTREETEQLMYEALQDHIEWMIEDGDFVPEQPSTAVYVVVPTKVGRRANQFLAIIQHQGNGYYAEVPKLDGCSAEGTTAKDVEQRIYEAIQSQVQVMERNQEPVPDNTLSAMNMAIPANVKETVAALFSDSNPVHPSQNRIFPKLIPPHRHRQRQPQPTILPPS